MDTQKLFTIFLLSTVPICLSGMNLHEDRPCGNLLNSCYYEHLHVHQLRKSKFLKTRHLYYGNSTATFQLELLLSGDINPNPGPDFTHKNNYHEPDSAHVNQPIIAYDRAQLLELNKHDRQTVPLLPTELWNHINELGINSRGPHTLP